MDSVVRALATAQTKLLAELPAGAYRIVLKDSTAKHMSFSDEPLIQSAGDSLRHEAARRILSDIQRVTRAFFDQTLRGRRSPILDGVVDRAQGRLRVDRFPPKRTSLRH